jgi:ATP-dependent DNA helicase RecQ
MTLRADPPREKAAKTFSRAAQRGPAAEHSADSTEAKIFEALRKLRRDLAKEQGLAAYMIFADRTLLEMAERRPARLEDLRAIHGVGERKIALYGEVFLDAIAQAAS